MTELAFDESMSLDQALANVVSSNPDQEALVFDETRVTYRELGQRINALAAGLHQLGITKGDKVAVILPNCAEFTYCFFGIGQAGGVFVPKNPLYRQREIKHILNDAEAVAAIFTPQAWGNDLLRIIQDVHEELPHLRHLIVHADSAPEGTITLKSLLTTPSPDPPINLAASEDLFGLIYTSGTTGVPKAVMHTHRTMLAPVIASDKLRRAMFERRSLPDMARMARTLTRYGTRFLRWSGKQQTMLTPSPFHAMAGYGMLLNSMLFGYRLVIMERFHPAQVLDLIQREHVNVLSATPTMFSVILGVSDFDQYDKSSVLYCAMGAAPCPPDLVRRVREGFGCPVTISFGATETGGGATVTRMDDPDTMQTDTVGRVFPGVRVKVVDDQRREVPLGQVGELACEMDGIMKGYYKAPEATAEALDDEGWYYTGDLAVMDEKGYVRIVGRKKDMIIRGGQNIFPVEIEHFLMTHPAIQAVAVVGVPDEVGSENVWAYVVPQPGANLTSQQVLDYCQGQIAPYKIPSEVRILDALPMTPTTKARKFRLREMALQEKREH
jgi:fatty-acyl-CoA synthase